MYEHYYIMGELQKQRACEIRKQVVEARMSNKKLFKSFLPYFKQNKQIGH